MWPFKKGWTRKQRAFRRACREEEKEVEQLINWLEINMPTTNLKTHQKVHNALAAGEARVVPTDPDQPKEDPSTAFPEVLADEFARGTAAEGDCCSCTSCPCHSTQQEE